MDRFFLRPFGILFKQGAFYIQDDYLLDGGVIVRIEPTTMRAWDYADAAYV